MTLNEILTQRRAYRSLESSEITPDIINHLAQAAQIMPSCFNNQPWRFVFVKDNPKLQNLKDDALSKGNIWAQPASMIIVVFSKADLDCVIKDREYYLFDVGMATAAIILRATEIGLVAHPIAGYAPEKVREIVQIPDEYKIVTLVIIGKKKTNFSDYISEDQKEREENRPPRLKIDEFTFLNQFSPKNQ
ncbi:MAG: nitroreductase [Promethearchaeota archaeon]|nr:MAG: nitroreductase [Candidatus Lokiarchaeota archaeon]